MLELFPSCDFGSLFQQLQTFLSFFEEISKFETDSYDFIHVSTFPEVLFSLLLNETFPKEIFVNILHLMRILTLKKYHPEKMPFLEKEAFFTRILIFLMSEEEEIITETLFLINNVLENSPNIEKIFSIQSFSQIIKIISFFLSTSNTFLITSESSKFLLLILRQNNSEFSFIIPNIISTIMKTTEVRPLTYLLQIILELMTENKFLLNFLVEQNICFKCGEVIKMMKKRSKFMEFYGDYALQILSLISNENEPKYFETIINNNIFEIYFEYEYSFLDLNENIHVDDDSFRYICCFLIGILLNKEPIGNELFAKYKIFQQICLHFITGSNSKKTSSLSVLSTGVAFLNIVACNCLTIDKAIISIFEFMEIMDHELFKIILQNFIKMIGIFQGFQEFLFEHHIIFYLDNIIEQDDNEELITEIETFRQILTDRISDS
ncbi:hypothetical protein TRFO_39230 [Tritrichomonas foetus]|uniref:Uncharacterized protein n=1 Tax=Tritrichomonas foetus TaxID=1144522 RepID=A0A1J4J8K9_9EUKA|nr:hypothetical protein TRFO_39230 [Tritrichomonas foetus]|eukprot:OHS94575.1 hypothetical protein TRFO_39230 [Tritrichomonas foetus]